MINYLFSKEGVRREVACAHTRHTIIHPLSKGCDQYKAHRKMEGPSASLW